MNDQRVRLGAKFEDALTALQAAEYLGFSVGHMAKLRVQNRGPAYIKSKSSGRIYYEEDALDAWRDRDQETKLTADC